MNMDVNTYNRPVKRPRRRS